MVSNLSNLDQDEVQFPRLIGALLAAGVFTAETRSKVCGVMGITDEELSVIAKRALAVWERIQQSYELITNPQVPRISE